MSCVRRGKFFFLHAPLAKRESALLGFFNSPKSNLHFRNLFTWDGFWHILFVTTPPLAPTPVICSAGHVPVAFHGEQCPLCVQMAMFIQAVEQIDVLCNEIEILTKTLIKAGLVAERAPTKLPPNVRFIDSRKGKK